ncbi:MAG: DUF3006 domain-containing protein, partial [Oscillospiraceae bacterium]
TLYVDRIEKNFAVCESDDGTMLKIPLESLPNDIKDGSVLSVDDNKNITHDYETEKARKSELFKLQNDLFSE